MHSYFLTKMHNKVHIHPPKFMNNKLYNQPRQSRKSLVCSLFLLPNWHWQLPAHQLTETKPRGLYQCITLQVLIQDTKYFVTFPSVYPTLPSPLSLLSLSPAPVPFTSRFLASFRRYLVKKWHRMFAQQQAT